MCGIAGTFGNEASDGRFQSLFAGVSHRGPDAAGVFEAGPLHFGMHRLRFRGPDVGLPVRGSGNVTAYNGQIFGHFAASGGYVKSVEDLAEEIGVASSQPTADGMFAYALYKPQEEQLLLATDAHFIKPLFYRRLSEGVAFASEMAPLLRCGGPSQIHLDALCDLFEYGWYLSDQSCAADVSLVCKADLSITRDGLITRPKRAAYPSACGVADDATLCARIRESVQRSTLGVGPLGLALSGGLDSSILAWELNALGVENLVCVTVRTPEDAERFSSLAELALPPGGAWQTWTHVVLQVDDDDFLHSFESGTRLFGQPTTMSSLPLYQRLADTASAYGVRAMLLGEGVDEYFGGYASYAKVPAMRQPSDYYRHPARQQLVSLLFGEHRVQAAQDRFDVLFGDCSDLRAIEVPMRLTRLLLRSDVCLMSRSIEGRVPFLYNRIPDLALTLPWHALARTPGKTTLRRVYASFLGARAQRAKVRFKSSDAMLLRCLKRDRLDERIAARCGRLLGATRVEAALSRLQTDAGFDADVLCLLMSLTFLLESDSLYGDPAN